MTDEAATVMVDELAGELAKQIRTDRLLETTRQLIAVPSVNPFGGDVERGAREQEVGDLYAEMMRAAGLDVVLIPVAPGRPNVVGTLGGGPDRSLMFAGHLDTVGVSDYDNPFDPRVDGGRLFGRGSCDMKAGLACFVEVARVLFEAGVGLSGDLFIAATADEEDRMIGSRTFLEHGPTPAYCIVGEPTSLAVCTAHKGQVGVVIRTYGTAAHSSVPDDGVNAIEKMGAVIAALDSYNTELAARPIHPLCGAGTHSIGVIRGGDIVSTVADYCEMEVDRRILPGETVADVLAEYADRLGPLAVADPTFRYDLSEPTIENAALDTATDSAVVAASIDAVRWATGRSAEVTAFAGSTDAPNLGAPAVILGPGSLAQAHGLNEYVEIAELEAAARIYLHAALSLLAAPTR